MEFKETIASFTNSPGVPSPAEDGYVLRAAVEMSCEPRAPHADPMRTPPPLCAQARRPPVGAPPRCPPEHRRPGVAPQRWHRGGGGDAGGLTKPAAPRPHYL